MRTSGILLHISSLPSDYGIGTFGREAYRFVDFLAKAGQTYWQILPIGITSFGDSPYQSFSSFAGNPYFIDPDRLIYDGYLEKADIAGLDFGGDPEKADFGKLNSELSALDKEISATEEEWEKFSTELEALRLENDRINSENR